MPSLRLAQVDTITARFDEAVSRRWQATRLWELADPAAWMRAHGDEVDLLVTSARSGCGAERLAQLPKLRAICSFGVGFDAIDVPAAKARGIAISTTPDVLNDCVADLAIGLLIDASRRIAWGDRFVRSGAWGRRKRFPLATRVSGKKLGILGLGRIGQAIARRAAGFSMDIRYHNRRPVPGCAHGYVGSLRELAAWADMLVVSVVGGPATRHLVDAEILDALGPEGILVNVARGSVVDEAALVAALRERRLGGAGLDVYASEPDVPAELFAIETVVLMPHMGSGTRETRLDMETMVLEDIAAFVEHGRLLHPL